MQTCSLDPAIVLAGGAKVPVTLLDGKQSEAFVRLLRAGADYQRLILLSDDFDGLAEFATNAEKGWAATLHPLSVMEVAEKAIDLNFSLARRWVELRAKLNAAVGGEPPAPADPSSPSKPSSAPMPASSSA